MKFMLKSAIAALALTVTGSAQAYDAFNAHTTEGWRRNSGVAAMAYFTMPFHATKREAAQPRFGLAMTAPQMRASTGLALRTDAPKLVDLSFTGDTLSNPWMSSLSVGNAIAWSSDPEQLPESMRHRFLGNGSSGVSWVIVGAATAALLVGAYLVIEDDVPPPADE